MNGFAFIIVFFVVLILLIPIDGPDQYVGFNTEDQVFIEELTDELKECVQERFNTLEVDGEQFKQCLMASYNQTSILKD